MHNPFAVAVQWPDEPRRYLVHLQRPYFTAALFETAAAAWLTVSWAPTGQPDEAVPGALFLRAADFCRNELGQLHVPIEFIERKNGHPLPQFLMAQTMGKELFIVEPDHSAPLVEVRDSNMPIISERSGQKMSERFDVITQWRLGEMRKYYQQFLERQERLVAAKAKPSFAS